MKLRILFLAIVLLMLPSLAQAQCAMCRAVLESADNQSMAQGINDGIIYLMIFPYLAIGGIGFFIYRSYKKINLPVILNTLLILTFFLTDKIVTILSVQGLIEASSV